MRLVTIENNAKRVAYVSIYMRNLEGYKCPTESSTSLTQEKKS